MDSTSACLSLDAASQFLGEGYIEVEAGRFVSQDGLRQVRMMNDDILGVHGGCPHMNFEVWQPRTGQPGRFVRTENIRIYFQE